MFEELRTAKSSVIAESLAEDISSALQESGSATADILLERALVAEAIEDLDMAREFLDRAIAVEPEFSEAWFQRALIFLNEGKFDQALYDLNEALTFEPRHFNAWLTLGALFEQLGESKQALKAYQEVLKIHPHHSTAQSQVRRLGPQVDGRSI